MTRILAVEDDDRIRAAVKLALEDEGWAVDEAASGEEALALFAQAVRAGRRFDAVFMDWQMPGLDGWEAARRIKALSQQGPKTLMLMVTAHGRELSESNDVLESALLDGYLLKPVTASMLADAVNGARNDRLGTPAAPRPASAQPLRGLEELAPGVRSLQLRYDSRVLHQRTLLEHLLRLEASLDLTETPAERPLDLVKALMM